MNIIFRPELHPRNRLGRFREILGSLKPGDSVSLPDGVKVQKRGRGAFRVTNSRVNPAMRGTRYPYKLIGPPVRDITPMSARNSGDKTAADTVVRLVTNEVSGMDSAPASPGVPGRLSPEAKAAQVQRVRDSLLMTKDLPGKGLDAKKTRRVLPPMSPGTGGLDENSIIDITGKAETAVEVASDQFDAMAEDQNKVSDIGFDDVQETIREINRSLADGTEPDWYDAHDAIKQVYVNAEDEGWINGHVQKQGLLDNIAKAENALMMAEDSYDQMIEDTSPQSPGTSEQGDAFAPLAGDGGLAPGSTLGANQGSISMTGAKIDRWAGGGLSDEPLDPMVSAELDAIPPGESARVGDVMVERIPYRTMDGGPGDGETAWIVPRSEEGNKANPLSKGLLFSPNYPLRDHENAASAIARIRVEAGQRAQDKNIGYREAMTEIQTPSIPLPQFPRTTPMSPGTDFDEDPSDQAIINKDRIDQDRWNKSFHSPLMKRIEAQDVAIESGGAYDAVLDPAELDKLVGGQLDYLFDNTRGSGHSFNFRQQIAQEIKRREGEDKAYDGADYDRYKPRGADGLVDLALMADRFGFEPTPPQSPGADGSIPTGSDQLNSMLAQVAAKKEAKAQPLASGDRVEDPDSGRTGTYQRGRMTGEPSVVWDDTPDSAEFYYEGELVPLPKAPMSPGTEKSMYDGTPRDKRGMAFDMSDAELLGTGSPVIGRDFKARPITPKEYQAALKHVTSLYFDETASLTEAAVAQELARTQRKLARQKPGARDKDLEETAELLETLLEDVSEADPQD